MLTPTSGTLADYNAAVLAGNQTHARLVFPVQNITLTDADISINGGISRTSIMNPEEDLVFGRAVMDELQVKLLNGSVFTGFNWAEEFHLDMGVDMNNSTNWVTVGYFKGKKPRRTIRTDVIEFIAYDRMQAFDILADEFLASVTYPVTLETLYHDLCTYCGVSYAAGDEMADAMALTYTEDPFTDGITCRTLLAWIAEANCCTAKINAAGNVRLTWFTDQTSNYSINSNKYFDIDIDENTVPALDSVRIASTEEEVSGFVYPVNGTNTYEIIDNPLLMFLSVTDKETIITDMVARFTALGSYIPASVTPIGNWMVETGDIIAVGYDSSSTMNMPIFNREFEWAGTGVDYYECVGNAERETVSQSAKEQYALGGKLSDKYTIQSGIDIDENGIDITGQKYVRIRSGGVLDVDSQNFKLNSNERTMQSGNWHFFDGGMYRLDEESHGYKRLFEIGDASNETADFKYFIRPVFNSRTPTGGTNYYYGVLDMITKDDGTRFTDVWNPWGLVPNDGGSDTFGGGVPCIMPIHQSSYYGNDQSVDIAPLIGYPDYQFGGIWVQRYWGDGVKNNLNTNTEGYVLDARQGKILNDTKTDNLVLTSSDDTWEKIWTKVNALQTNRPYAFYSHATPANILSTGVRNNTLVGMILRTDTDKFGLIYRLGAAGNALATAYWTGMSSSLRGTYSERNITGEISAVQTLAGMRSLDVQSISANSNKNITLESNGRYFIIFNSVSSSGKCIAIVSVTSTGTVNANIIGTASNLSFDTGTANKLKVTNGTTQTVKAYIETLTEES